MSFCQSLHKYLVFSSEDDVEDDSDGYSDELNDDADGDNKSPRNADQRKTARQTGRNGHQPVDHRPPEKLLQRAEKKIARYIEQKKVS